MPHVIQLSIRGLVEFLLKSGSIDSRFSGLDRGQEGARLHRRLQKQGGENYVAEVSLTHSEPVGDFIYMLTGRADGVITDGAGVTVDEIKTVASPLDTLTQDRHPAHWAQAQIYAYILCRQRQLHQIAVQLTYCHIETLAVKRFVRTFTDEDLTEFVRALLTQYERWARLTVESKQKRDAHLKTLGFPFPAYREGQRSLAAACYAAFKSGGSRFCCAPTGIGKTISTLFPAMKALGEGFGDRIFYLTAKTVTRKAAEEALAQFGALPHFKSLTLTAKDKACMLDERICLPEHCPYAKGYYDRVNDAVYALLAQHSAFDRETLEKTALDYRLCPYELSLDLALWCDLVICDYNYLFDPVVHLQRFFESKSESLFLIDEAHNLVDRSREMYSAALHKSAFLTFKKTLPKPHKRLHAAVTAVNKAFIELRKRLESDEVRVISQTGLPHELDAPLNRFTAAAEEYLEQTRGGAEVELLPLYFDVLFYRRIAECYAENYVTLLYRGDDFTVRLYCLDPSEYLKQSLSLGRGSVLFSATLQPLAYYRETLGGGDAACLTLQSPFCQENLGLFVANGISTKFKDRDDSLTAVCALLEKLVSVKRGNYIAYFPSYSYMQTAWAAFTEAYPDIDTVVQQSGMDERARDEFLNRFGHEPDATLLGFCVLGGIFAEGVDLSGNRLIGTAIVGVGLPMIGPVPDAVRRYYDEKSGMGYEYAYQFPGMNKVLQAAGRVIRTETDRGVVLLVDNRFTTARYRSLFPPHWSHWQRIDLKTAEEKLTEFWKLQTGTE